MYTPRRAYPSSGIIPLIFFVLTAAAAVGLFLAALLIWLSEFTGSMLLACIATGGVAALAATVTYFASVRDSIRRMREYIETVTEISRLAKAGYEWALEQLLKLFE